MTSRTIPASALAVDMTLVVDGQHHLIEEVAQHDDDGPVYVQAETVIGDVGQRAFTFTPDQSVRVL